jgi:hypothetical protein
LRRSPKFCLLEDHWQGDKLWEYKRRSMVRKKRYNENSFSHINLDDRQDEGVTVIYSNGDICGSDHSRRKTVVNFQCHVDSGLSSSNSLKRALDIFATESAIHSIDDSDDCTTIINVATPFACAVNKKFYSGKISLQFF